AAARHTEGSGGITNGASGRQLTPSGVDADPSAALRRKVLDLQERMRAKRSRCESPETARAPSAMPRAAAQEASSAPMAAKLDQAVVCPMLTAVPLAAARAAPPPQKCSTALAGRCGMCQRKLGLLTYPCR